MRTTVRAGYRLLIKSAVVALCLLACGLALAQAPVLIGVMSAISGTTASINSTGANAAVVCYMHPNNSTAIVSDNQGNRYAPVILSNEAYGGNYANIGAAFGITTSSSHTFSVTGGYAFTVMLFSNLASPDQTATNTSLSPPQPMTVTPGAAQELVTMCSSGAAHITEPIVNNPSSPFTAGSVAQSNLHDGNTYPITMGDAYYVTGSGTPTAVTGQMDVNAGNGMASAMASFYSIAHPIPPTITAPAVMAEGAVGHPYIANALHGVCPVEAGGVQPYTVSITGLPAGYTYDTNTGCIGGTPSATATDAAITFHLTDLQGQTATSSSVISTASTQLAVAGGTCPLGKQLQSYSCNVMSASGGIGTLSYASSPDTSFMGLPFSMTVDPSTGVISSAHLMDQGDFVNVGVQATDIHGGAVLNAVAFNIDGDNTFGGVKIFPDDAIYHLNVRNVPNDTSIRQKVPGFMNVYNLQVEFGSDPGAGGMPINTVPANQPFVSVTNDNGGNLFATGPIPCDAAMEGDVNGIFGSSTIGFDMHTLVLYLPGIGADGLGHSAKLYEQYNNYPYSPRNPITPGYSGPCKWGNPNDPFGGGYGGSMLPTGSGDLQTAHTMPNLGATTDAAGLPIVSELLNYDEVLGTGTVGHENGVIRHAVRMTVQAMSQFWQWPGTSSASQGPHDLCPVTGMANNDFKPWDQANPIACINPSTSATIVTTGQTLPPGGAIYHIPPPGSIFANVALSAGGTGYTSNPTMVFSGGGCTTEPTGFGVAAGGAVVDGRVATNGLGCTSAPTLAFSGGGGSGAAGTVTLSAEPAECSATPINHIFYQAMTDYGVIVADGGLTGRVIGTRDARWPDWGTLNTCFTKLNMANLVMPNVSITAVDPTYESNQIKPEYVIGVVSLPAVTTTFLPGGTVGTPYSTAVAASGGTGPYTWTITGTLPIGLGFNTSTGVISGTPTNAGTATGLSFTVTDSTSATASSIAMSLTISPATLPVAATPTFSPVAGTYTSVQSVAISTATSGATLCFTTDGSTPTANGVGTCIHGTTYSSAIAVGASLTLKAIASKSGNTDSGVGTAAYVISIPVTVTPTCAPAAGTFSSPQSVTCSSATSSSITYCTVDGSAPTTGSPVCTGITVASTRTLKAFSAAGGHTDSAVLSQAYTISIPSPPTITTSSLPSGMVGSVYSLVLAASGGSGPYTWVVWSGTLPAGLTLSSGGTISGTPTAAGTASVAFKVTDSLSATATSSAFSLVIAPPVAPTVTTTTLPPGIVGSAYSATLAANAGTLPYTWAIASGTLPTGLSLASNGVISGTPTNTGSSSLTFRVTDALGATSLSAAITLLVNSPSVTLAITTTSLPGGTAGAAYSTTLHAQGGSTPYVWSVLAGTLPSGLQLDSSTGVISGTPAVSGVYTGLVIRVSDSASHTATSGALAIVIATPVPPSCCGVASIGRFVSIGHVGFF